MCRRYSVSLKLTWHCKVKKAKFRPLTLRYKVDDAKQYSGRLVAVRNAQQSPMWTRTALAAEPDHFSLARYRLCGRRASGNRLGAYPRHRRHLGAQISNGHRER